MKKQNLRYILIGAVILIFIGMQDTIPKRAVADVEGRACIEDKDCPCFGKIEGTDIESFGIGVASCDENTKTCDTSFCVDVQPVGVWAKNNPWQWVKDNILVVLGIIGVLYALVLWPSQ